MFDFVFSLAKILDIITPNINWCFINNLENNLVDSRGGLQGLVVQPRG